MVYNGGLCPFWYWVLNLYQATVLQEAFHKFMSSTPLVILLPDIMRWQSLLSTVKYKIRSHQEPYNQTGILAGIIPVAANISLHMSVFGGSPQSRSISFKFEEGNINGSWISMCSRDWLWSSSSATLTPLVTLSLISGEWWLYTLILAESIVSLHL